MVAGTKDIRYKTAPLKSWNKARELRLHHYKEIQDAHDKGELLVGGSVQAFPSLIAGFGHYAHLGGEAYGATIATDPDFALKCAEAVEARGYARDLCSYMRNYWGSMFLDRYPFGGKFPKPNFLLQLHFCGLLEERHIFKICAWPAALDEMDAELVNLLADLELIVHRK